MTWMNGWEVKAAGYLREAAPASYARLEAAGELEPFVRSVTTRGLDQYERMVSAGDNVEASLELCWDDIYRALVPVEPDDETDGDYEAPPAAATPTRPEMSWDELQEMQRQYWSQFSRQEQEEIRAGLRGDFIPVPTEPEIRVFRGQDQLNW